MSMLLKLQRALKSNHFTQHHLVIMLIKNYKSISGRATVYVEFALLPCLPRFSSGTPVFSQWIIMSNLSQFEWVCVREHPGSGSCPELGPTLHPELPGEAQATQVPKLEKSGLENNDLTHLYLSFLNVCLTHQFNIRNVLGLYLVI